jgi:hypothetical protein
VMGVIAPLFLILKIEEKKVSLMKVDTLKNVADSLTKSVNTEKFSWCRGSMGIVDYVTL